MTQAILTVKCPNCGFVVDRQMGHASRIESDFGSPIGVCLKCQKTYLTGMKHAGMMSDSEFNRFFAYRSIFTVFRIACLCIVASIIFVGATGMASGAKGGDWLVAPVLTGFIIGCVISAILLPKRYKQYKEWRPSKELELLWVLQNRSKP